MTLAVLPNPVAAKTSNCDRAYQDLYEDRKLDIAVVFGYKDARPARFVGDRHERLVFVQTLLSPCTGRHQACGFKRLPGDADSLYREIGVPYSLPVRIHVRVVHSSVGPDDRENRTDPFQKWQSEYARLSYQQAMERAEVVFYNGHSRSGGGPDFTPPRLLADESVDSESYKTEQAGLRLILETFRKMRFRPLDSGVRVMGLFSCASSSHFASQVMGARKGLALISSEGLLYYADALENSLSAISALLERKCEREFKAALRHSNPQEGSQIRGFFSP